MKLRHAGLADAESIAEIHAASWRSTYGAVLNSTYLAETVPSERRQLWRERLTSPKPNQLVVAAEVDGRIVGFACVFSENHNTWGAYLDNLHVSHGFQGRGIGRALLAEVALWCESQSPGRGLYLSVNQDNHRAQRFYLALGARNTEPGIWNAPDGSKVPTFWFTWNSVASLAQATDPSIEKT